MAVYTGIVGKISVDDVEVSGVSGTATEATIVVGKERGKFNLVGTDVSENTTGMKTVEGTITRKWISGDTTLQDLVDGSTEFTCAIEIDGQGTSITASGCAPNTITRRVAPGTDVMLEVMPFVGRNWY